MSKKGAKNSQAEAEAKYRIIELAIDKGSALLNHAVKWLCLLGIAFYAYLCMDTLAGKITEANIAIDAALSANLGDEACPQTNPVVPWIAAFFCLLAAISGITYGVSQRHAYKTHIKSHSRRVGELERLIDQNRTSSNLGEDGSTRPEDV